jgi:hypothetical protein
MDGIEISKNKGNASKRTFGDISGKDFPLILILGSTKVCV